MQWTAGVSPVVTVGRRKFAGPWEELGRRSDVDDVDRAEERVERVARTGALVADRRFALGQQNKVNRKAGAEHGGPEWAKAAPNLTGSGQEELGSGRGGPIFTGEEGGCRWMEAEGWSRMAGVGEAPEEASDGVKTLAEARMSGGGLILGDGQTGAGRSDGGVVGVDAGARTGRAAMGDWATIWLGAAALRRLVGGFRGFSVERVWV